MPDSNESSSASEAVDANFRSLDRRLATGVAWSGGTKWALQLLSWPMTLLTARLLTPADYGLLAVLTVITRFMMLVTEGGFGAAVVSGPSLDDKTAREMHGLCISSGTVAFAIVVIVGVGVSTYAQDPKLLSILAILGATLVLEGLNVVPLAMIRRRLDFRTTAVVDVARNVTDLSVTLVLAFLGAKYWSLVIGYTSGLVVSTIVIQRSLWIAAQKPTRARLEPILHFTRPLLLRNIAGFLAYSGDAAIGKLSMAKESLGHYTLAFTIAYAPGDKITQVILRVVPAILGNVRDSVSEVRRYFLSITLVIALLTFPMFAGIAFVAPDVIRIVLGEKWAPMAAVIRPLCIFGAIAESTAMVAHVLQTLGDTRVLMRQGFWALLVMPLGFFLLSRQYGAPGLASAWAIGTAILVAQPLMVACRRLQISLGEFFSTLFVPTASTALMLAALTVADTQLHVNNISVVLRLAIHIALGALVYGLLVMLMARAKLAALWRMLTPLFPRSKMAHA